MAGLADFRKQYPQYDDIPDQQLADSLHQKFYSDIPKEQYYQSLGITTGTAAAPADARTAEEIEAERPARAIRLNGGRRVALVRDVDQGRDNWDKDTQGEKRAPWTGEGGVLEAAPAMGVAGTRSAVANLRRMAGEESATQRREALGVRMPSAGDIAHAAEEGAEPPKPAQAFDPMKSGETPGGAVTGRVRQGAIDRQRGALQRDEAALKAAERDVNVAQMDLLNVTPADMNTAQQAVTSLAQSAAPTMIGVAAGILTRNPALAMSIAGGGGSAIQAGSTYGEAREKGASHRLSAMAATIDGVLEGVGEALPLGIALKHGSPIANRIFGTIAAEAGQEAATQAMQDFNAFLTYNPDITLQEAWEGIKVAALTGAMGGSIYGTAGAIADASRQRALIRENVATDLKTGTELTAPGDQNQPVQGAVVTPPERDPEDINAELNTLAGEIPRDRALQRGEAGIDDGLAESAPINPMTEEQESDTGVPESEMTAMQLAMKRAQERAQGTRTDPVQAETEADVEAASANVETAPTEAQKEAGNYAKGRLKLQGLDIAIENPKDSVRSGQDANGQAWEVTMPAAYGYVKRTTGKDGDQVDVYIGPDPKSRQVYIIDQIDPKTGRFDEHKVLVGFGDQSDALAAYDQAFSDGSGEARRGAVTPMAMGKFKEWLKKGDTTKAYAYKFVSPAIDALKNDEMLRASIVGMRAGLGAAEQGGRLVIDEVNRDRSPGGGDVLFRNEWVGNQWWFERPDPGLLAPQAQRAIDKALAGERLGEREARFVEYLIERAREFDRQFDADFVESSGYNDLTPAEQKAVDEVVADAIAVLGESTVEDIKERLALQTESEAEYEARLREELSEAVAAAGNRQATAATAEGEAGESAGRGEQDSRASPEIAGGVDGQGDSVSAADTGVADRQRSDQPAVRRGAASEERSDAPPTGQPPDGAATEAVADKTPSKEGVSVSEDTQSDFVPAPGGGIDYGEITPDQAAAMRRQAGKIRLQRGVHNADGTGHGLAHIEANHGKQIKNAGFDSVQDFVAHISSRFNEILQAPQGRQLLVAVTNGRRDVMFVQLEPSADGEFYRVNTAFPASRDYLEKREAGGAKVLWSGSEPRSTATGRQPPYAGGPEDVSGRGAPIARGKSTEPDTTTTPDLELTGETPADLAAKAQAEAARSMADAAKAMKETADAMRESFTLTGSKRAADEAAARGQGDLLAQREEPRPAANKAGEKIEDFGKKIAGARKDYAAEFRERMAEAMETDIASVPLSQSWPEPDYDKLLEGGADPWAVGFAHAARDEVPTKPQSSWRLSNWVAEVRLLRSMTEKVMSGDLNPAEVRKRLELQERLLVVADRAELYTVVGHGRSLKGVRISQGRYGVHNGIPYDPPKIIWTVESKAKKTAMSHWPTEHANGSTREEAIENFKKAWAAPQAEQESKAVDFGIYSRSGENTFFIGKKIGRDVIPLKTGFKKSMDARIWKAENQAELVSLLERFKDVPYERRLTNEPRVGEDHRQGANITPEQFREAFGFRGGQFGNSMPQDERQAHLNEAYDAMMDLAGVLGVPPKALSLNGELGLAFGARGTGGIRAPSAHYEQDVTGQVTDNRVVINLTRKKGAGSLAHEWFHAVDNYFARMQGKKASFVTDDPSGTGLRPEMQNAFRRIMAAIDSTGLPARSRNLDRTRGKPYWATRLEMAARTFESYVIAKLQDQGASNDYLANVVSKEFWDAAAALGIEKENTYPYPDASEIPAIRAAFDEFFRAVETKETVSGVAMFSRANPEELDFAADFVTELAAHDELFRHRVSASSDLGTVFSEVAPTYRFMGEDTRADERAESGADRRFAVVTPQRKVFHVYERGNEVWIDVSRSDPGEGGNFVYAAVLNYAHNAKKVLIGDPAAVSQDAVVRRTVAMLSSALRFGTTRHMRPAAEQTEGNPAVGIAPLEWSSDEAQNLRNLIDTFLQTTYNQNPEIEGIRYDFASRQFVENGTPVTRDRFNELAKTFRDRTGRSGQSSIRRAGLLQSLVRSESGGRPGLLEDVFRRGAEHVSRGMAAYGPEGSGQTVPNLKGVFSRTEAPERGLSVSAIETALRPILDRWQATPDVVILPSIAQAPAAIREQDAAQRSQGASGAPEGMFWGGRVYLFADALPSVDRAQTVLFHEVLGHYGLRGAFGAELDAVLDQLANVRAGQVARKARDYGLDIKNPEHRRHAAEEVLAELAQTQPKSTWVQRAVAAIKRFLRGLGLNVPVSDSDIIADYILPARRFVEQGAVAPEISGDAAMASRQDQTNTQEFRRWFAGSKVVDAQGRPLVVYHVTSKEFSEFKGDRPIFVAFDERSARMAASGGGITMPLYAKAESPANTPDTPVNFLDVTKAFDSNPDADAVYVEDEGGVSLALRSNTQIKSAVSNTGAFDPGNPDIRFSRKQISEATGDANADLKQPHSEFIGDYIGDLSTFKKFAVYPRTIAALEPDFTPVYRTAESQFETRDRYAAELGRMAEKYFDLTQEERGRVDAVLELGRLKGEVLAGKKMSMENTGQTARLSKKGDTVTLTDAEKSAYWGVRKMFDKALTMFRDQALRDFGIPVEKLGRDIRGALEKRITEAEPRQKAYLRAALEIFDQIEKARESGYVPFTRWGDVVIVVRDRTGATLWVGKVETGMVERNIPGRRNLESIPSVRNALNEARTRFRGEQVEIKAFNTPERIPLEGDIRMADLDMLAELAQVDNQQWDSVRDQLAKGLQSRGFRKHFLGADSVPGYSADFERAIADYIIGLSGYLSRRQHAEKWETGIAAIDKRKPRLIEYAKNYQNYVNDPQEEWVRLRQAGFLYYIAGVPASAFVNLTQVQLLSAPYMTQFIGASRVQAELARAYKDASLMGSVSRGFDLFDPAKAPADVREDLQAAWDEGFFVPLETYELMGKAYNRTPTQRRLQQGIDDGISAVSIAFQGAERINRLVTFIAAHRIARIRGVEGKVDAVLKANPLARDELGVFSPRSFAEWVIDETHFRMGKINRPGLMRGAGAAILQFRGFTLQTLELWTRMMLQNGPEGRAMAAYSLALMFAVAGLWGMPGADDLRNLLERFYKAVVGEDLDLKTKFRELVYRLSGSAMLAQMLSKGVTYPAGLDLSGRIGMGNIAPDSALQVFGIPADLLIGREVRALEMASRGHWQLAMAELLPNFIKNPMQAADWAESGIRSQATGKVAIPAENVTAGDVTQKAIGFTPARISNIREAQWAKTRANRAVDELRSDYYAKLGTTIAAKVRAERAGDVDKAARLEADVKATFKEIAERNQGKAHHEMIIIRAQTLRERVRDELEGTTSRQIRRRQARSRSQEIDAAYGVAP